MRRLAASLSQKGCNMKIWGLMTAADLGRDIERGRINPVELAEYFLDAIATHPLAPRIYARTTETRARGEAMGAAARAKSGLRRGPLDGVPLSWKDCRGFLGEWSSSAWPVTDEAGRLG